MPHFLLLFANNKNMKNLSKFIYALLTFLLIINIKPIIPMSAYCSALNLKHELQRSYPKSESCIRIMNYNILADALGFGGTPATTRKNKMSDLLSSINPDILTLQEVSSGWFKIFKNYTFLKFNSPIKYTLTGTMTVTAYNPENMLLLKNECVAFSKSDDSRLRRIDFSLFQRKKTGEQFIVINTHLSIYNNDDLPASQIIELINYFHNLQNKYSCPIFLTGDFNSCKRSETAQPGSTTVYEYLSLYFENCADIAVYTSGGSKKSLYSDNTDHIFISGTAHIEKLILLSMPQLSNLSDHYPVFADVILKQ